MWQSFNSYDDLCYPVNTNFEVEHGGPHTFCGGTMTNLVCSPNDPIFFSHHCYVDYVLQMCRDTQNPQDRDAEYPTRSSIASNETPGRYLSSFRRYQSSHEMHWWTEREYYDELFFQLQWNRPEQWSRNLLILRTRQLFLWQVQCILSSSLYACILYFELSALVKWNIGLLLLLLVN